MSKFINSLFFILKFVGGFICEVDFYTSIYGSPELLSHYACSVAAQ